MKRTRVIQNKNRFIISGFVIVLSLACLGCFESPTEEKAETLYFSMRFNPGTVDIVGEDNVSIVDVWVDDANALIAARFIVSFDPSIIEITKVETSGMDFIFSEAGADVSELELEIDNVNGRILVGVGAIKSGFTGASGSGSLALITMKSKSIGQSGLSFVKAKPEDLLLTDYSAASSSGWVENPPVISSGKVVVEAPPVEPPK